MNNIVNGQTLSHLSTATRRLAALLSRPKLVAIMCLVSLTILAWGAYGLMLIRPEEFGETCGVARTFDVARDALVLLMWEIMTLAMMLPSAGPMILTYAEIADTAVQKNEPVVSPLVLAAGYLLVWYGFAGSAAWLQTSLASAGIPEIAKTPAAAVLFIAAGLYQFSRLKAACLMLCQRPFPFFFANWTTKIRGVFVLGLRQGAYCLGCCWGLMLLMFAVGAMNAIWMALLAVVMTIEKMTTGLGFSRMLGVALIAIGFAFVTMEFN